MHLTPEQLARFKAQYAETSVHHPAYALGLLAYINDKWPSFVPAIIHAVTTKDEATQ